MEYAVGSFEGFYTIGSALADPLEAEDPPLAEISRVRALARQLNALICALRNP